MNKKKVLVTGAAGFIGSHISETLLSRGYEVVGLYVDIEPRIKQEGFYAVRADITNGQEVKDAFAVHRPEAVFHTAAKLPEGEQEPSQLFDVNVKGTLNILEACLRYGVEDVVYSSSMSVYGNEACFLPVDEKHPTAPYDHYSLSKLQGEEACEVYVQRHNLNIVILRYAGVYGPGRNNGVVFTFLQQALKNKTIEIHENTSWDIVYVKDVALANALALEKARLLRGEIINIGSGEEISVQRLAEEVVELAHSKSQIQFRGSSSLARRFFYDISKMKKTLNFAPRSPHEGLREYLKEIT